MTQAFKDIILWFHNEKNYQQGLLLLAKYGRNAALLRNLMKPGKEKFGGPRKLSYTLAKIAGFNPINTPELPKELSDGLLQEAKKKVRFRLIQFLSLR